MLRQLVIAILFFSLITISSLSADNLSLPRVIDQAGFLSAQEKSELEMRIDAIRERYAFDAVIVTVHDIGDQRAEVYADDYYDYNGYGIGSNASGALLLQAVNSRDIHISGCGKGISVFSSWKIGSTLDKIIPYLQRDDYFGAYKIFLAQTENYLSALEQDKKYQKVLMYPASAALALLLSLITFFSFRSKHKTVQGRHFAGEYIKQESLRFTLRNDTFISTFTARTRKNTGSSSRGFHTGSSGRSHSGGGRKY